MYQFDKLKNGVQLITAPMSGTKTVTALVTVGTGSKYEEKGKSGISHFLEHMFFKGTTRRPSALAISAELDGIGAEYNAFTGKEYTGYYIKAQAGKLERALDVLSDMLFYPLLKEEEIEREKGVIIEELNMYMDNPMMFIEDVFENLLYGDTPAGRDTVGTKKTIAGMKRGDFTGYLNSQYATRNTVICLAGDITSHESRISGTRPPQGGDHFFPARPEHPRGRGNYISTRLKEGIEEYFSKKEFNARGKNFKEKEAVVERQTKPAIKLHFKKTDQAHLSLGARTFGYRHKDRAIIKLVSVMLGGSMSSRLFSSLRERRGLAYYVRSDEEHYTDCGYLTARAGVPVDKIEAAVKIILEEYKKLRKIMVDKNELKRVKDLIRGRFAIQLESSDNVASWYARQAVMYRTLERSKNGKTKINTPRHPESFRDDTPLKGGIKSDIVSPEEFLDEIDKVTAGDIKRVASEIFTDERLNLAVIGPYENAKTFYEILNL